MKKLAVAILIALCYAVPSAGVSGALCNIGGGVTVTYGVVNEPFVVDGLLRWNHDNDLFITTNLDCIVQYDIGLKPQCLGQGTYIQCWMNGYTTYRGAGLSIVEQDGVLSWQDRDSGIFYWANAGCVVLE